MSTSQDFFHYYRMLYRPYLNLINSILMKYQLYSSQWLIIRLLANKGPHNLIDIAQEVYVEKPSVSRLITKLSELGYVQTKPGMDKREKYAYLTKEGEEVYQIISDEINEIWVKAMDGISEEHQQIASIVLEKVKENIISIR